MLSGTSRGPTWARCRDALGEALAGMNAWAVGRARHRIVIVSPHVPARRPDNAGVGYLDGLDSALTGADVVYLVPDTAANRTAQDLTDGHRRIVIATTPGRAFWLARRLRTVFERLTPTRADVGFLDAIRANPAARKVLEEAEVVDTQWPAYSALLPRLAKLAPHARAIATLHDVASQGYLRELGFARTPARWLRLAVSYIHARQVEHRVARTADTVLVFSEKDIRLLPRRAAATVVFPPLALSQLPSPPQAPVASTPPFVLFVGPLYRLENVDGLTWFATEAWPQVRAAHPSARLVVAGSLPRHPDAALEAVPGIDLRGFVDDLDSLYATASVVVAPLRLGAGVKFKVLEAIAHGAPVVTTSIAAEGIGDTDHSRVVRDDASSFARAVVAALDDPAEARARESAATSWLGTRYGRTQFERTIAGVYGVVGPRGLTTEATVPALKASVVIPVRNGEHGIGNELAALARQPDASLVEVIVSDNRSTDRTREVALAYRNAFADLRIVDSSDRLGVSHARNVGIQAARSEKILICDHDDEVRLGWITALCDALDHADVVGGRAVSTRISTSENALEPEQEGSDTLRSALGYLPYAIGCCLAIRRTPTLEIGGFDEAFQKGHEETDYCWRMQQAGYTIAAAPEAIVDYRQRGRAIDAGRQRFHSARTQVLLWTRHERTGQLRPVSFRGSLRGVLHTATDVPLLFRRSTRFAAARSIGWAVGTLDGHLRYRILGTPPQPILNSKPATTHDEFHKRQRGRG